MKEIVNSEDYIQIIGIMLLCVSFTILLAACSGVADEDLQKSGDFGAGNMDVGLLFSSDTGGEKTEIVLLDGQWDAYARCRLQYAGFADFLTLPQVVGNSLYACPQGSMEKSDCRSIVELDLKSGNAQSFVNDEPLKGPTDMCVVGRTVYTCANLNGESFLGVYDLDTGKRRTRKFNPDDPLITSLVAADDRVFCMGSNSDEEHSILVVDARTLQTEKKIRLRSEPTFPVIHGDHLYCSLDESADTKDGIETTGYVLKMDVRDLRSEMIPLSHRYSMLNVMCVNGGILVADSDWQSGDSGHSQWIFWDIGKQKQFTWAAEDSILQTENRGNTIYALCDGKYENGTLYQYRFGGRGMVTVRAKRITEALLGGGADCFFLPER